LLVVLVDLPSQVWNVDSSVALTGEEELVSSELWEVLLEEDTDCHQSIFGGAGVTMVSVCFAFSLGESNTSWLFEEKHACVFVPWMWVFVDFSPLLSVINDPWAILLEVSKKGGASWSTVVPKDNWISGWIIHRLDKDVMKSLASADVQEPRVRVSQHGQVGCEILRHSRELVLHLFGGDQSNKGGHYKK
jgi:hypothetical protein